ncbi:MAG: ankyrin repeat domain-containing protein [Planctomycetota bacterium]|jgi:hypothetical protein
MLLKVLFWLFVALDVGALGLMFLLGLAAAGPSKTSPLAVVFAMLVVPGALLAGAIFLHLRAQSGLLQLLAFGIVSAPVGVLVVGRIVGEFTARSNPGGIWGETKLTRALRELEKDPQQLATVRQLLAEGADPNEMGEEVPLVLAIYAARHAGPEPTQLLLARGADPNRQDQFGRPCWFAATARSVDLEVLKLLLDRGADPKATGRDGRGGVWGAIATDNWPAALLLVQRGCPTDGSSPMGLPLREVLAGYVRQGDARGAGAATLLAELDKRK